MKTNILKTTGLKLIIVFCLAGFLASCSNEIEFGEESK